MTISEAIIKLTNNPDAAIRRQAAEVIIAMGELDSDAVKALAGSLADQDLGVRDICFRALASATGSDAVLAAAGVAPLILDKNIEIRNLAGDILITLKEYSIAPLIPYLKDSDEDVRKFALDILGLVGNEDILGEVFPLLFDSDMNVKCSAVDAIGNIRAEIALDELIRLYFADDELKPFIIGAIAKIGSDLAQSFITQRLKTEDDFFLQTACIDALSICGEDFGICLELFGIMPDAPAELQPIMLKTIYAIAFRLGEPLELPDNLKDIALTALDDDDPDIRAAGLIALGNYYRIEDIDALAKELKRNDSETKQHIIHNLMVYSGGESVIAFIRKIYNIGIFAEAAAETLDMFAAVWDIAIPENKIIAIDIISELIFETPVGNTIEVLEILIRISEDRVIENIKKYIPLLNDDSLSELIDFIQMLRNYSLFPELEAIATSGKALSEKALSVISEMKNIQ